MSQARENTGKNKDGSEGKSQDYASTYHAPVLCDVVVQGLVTNRAGVYVDATLGGGGHSAALLDQLDGSGRVYGIDQDADAIAAARKRLANAEHERRFEALRGNFSEMAELLEGVGVRQVDGVLLDLGVSSYQLDTAARGFSYAGAGELDMRMDDRGGVTAADIVNGWDTNEMIRLFRRYGEEPSARRIAHAIVSARPILTTDALAEVIRNTVSSNRINKTLARVFQALRIQVNDELAVLEETLKLSVGLIRPGGRIVVISYHSLEDRRVKRFLKYGNLEGKPVRDFYGHLQTPWRLITRKAIKADEREINLNPRARSARLRIAEKISTEKDSPAEGAGAEAGEKDA